MTRTARLIRLARARGDRAALAILEAGRRYDPTPWPSYILRLPA